MASVASSLSLAPLADGALSAAPIGAHVVLEAAGVLLHAARVPEGLVALRRGSVQSFSVARMPPAAALVHYPPPFGPLADAEAMQAAERARGLIGLDIERLTERLTRAGADASDLSGEAGLGECLASFCATGAARCWKVSEAYRSSRSKPENNEKPVAEVASAIRPSGVPAGNAALSSPFPRLSAEKQREGFREVAPDAAQQREKGGYVASNAPSQQALPDADETTAGADEPRSQLSNTVTEKAISTAVHVGMRGPAAKIAGAAAAIGCEGYALYKDIGEHSDALESRVISSGQFQERVAESTIASSGRAIGGLAGAVAGQAAIPVPVVGAVVGGVVGAACGGLHATSFSRGAFRLTGSKAKGGDDLVRCIEHKPRSEIVQGGPCDGGIAANAAAENLQEDLLPSAPTRGAAYGGLEEEEQLL